MSLISKTEQFVKNKHQGESSGHDWWHIEAVRKNALLIAQTETCDLEVVELAALLHDIADSKFHNGDHSAGALVARDWLESQKLVEQKIEHICKIIEKQSFSASSGILETIEAQIVQDADRLEALGAIGIARCFAYGGKKGRLIYDPTGITNQHSIQHFYDKLLTLIDLFNTEEGKKLAQPRHDFLKQFLDQFLNEWG